MRIMLKRMEMRRMRTQLGRREMRRVGMRTAEMTMHAATICLLEDTLRVKDHNYTSLLSHNHKAYTQKSNASELCELPAKDST